MGSNSNKTTNKPLTEKQLAHLRRIASLGGKAVVEKHGTQHMAEIGRRGFEATVEKYFDGDPQAAKKWLTDVGKWATDIPGLRIWPHPGPHPAHREDNQDG